jgi:hypothetical protein
LLLISLQKKERDCQPWNRVLNRLIPLLSVLLLLDLFFGMSVYIEFVFIFEYCTLWFPKHAQFYLMKLCFNVLIEEFRETVFSQLYLLLQQCLLFWNGWKSSTLQRTISSKAREKQPNERHARHLHRKIHNITDVKFKR